MSALVGLTGLTGLTACARPSADITPAAAAQLQEAVEALVRPVADGRYEGAEAQLARTRAILYEAADAGQLSVARYRSIDDALRAVEAELGTMVAALDTTAADEEGEPVSDAASGPKGSGGSGGGSGSGSGGKGPPDHANPGGRGR